MRGEEVARGTQAGDVLIASVVKGERARSVGELADVVWMGQVVDREGKVNEAIEERWKRSECELTAAGIWSKVVPGGGGKASERKSRAVERQHQRMCSSMSSW